MGENVQEITATMTKTLTIKNSTGQSESIFPPIDSVQQTFQGVDTNRITSIMRINWVLIGVTQNFIKTAKFQSNIVSESFELAVGKIKTKWHLRCCPNGDHKEDRLSIYIYKDEESSQNYEFSYRFTIMKNKEGKKSLQWENEKAGKLKVGSGTGFPEFITHSELFCKFDEYVSGNQLHFQVDLVLSAPNSEAELLLHQFVVPLDFCKAM